MVVGANAPLADFGARPRSIGRKRLTRKERRELAELTRSLAMGRHYKRRPKTVGECAALVPGPCPWVGCRFNLFLDVDEETGVTRIAFPGKEIDELEETCALRVAAKGEHTLERTGELVNVTLERLRQIEEVALVSLRGTLERAERRAARREAAAAEAPR